MLPFNLHQRAAEGFILPPHTLTRDEYLQTLAKRVLYSRAYTCFFVSVIVAGVVEVLWIVVPQGGVGTMPQGAAFTAIETYVTLGLVCELCIRASVQWRRFFTQAANLVDTAVAAVSVTSSVLIAVGLETKTEMLIAELLVVGRVLFRLLRLLAITKAFKRQQAAADRKLEVNLDDELPLYQTPSTPELHHEPRGQEAVGGHAFTGFSLMSESASGCHESSHRTKLDPARCWSSNVDELSVAERRYTDDRMCLA